MPAKGSMTRWAPMQRNYAASCSTLRGIADLCNPPFELHLDAVFRTQRDQRLHLNALAQIEPKTPVLRHSCKHENAFHPGETLSNTAATSATKWEVRKLR